jgi:hypothetical protein
MQTAVAVYASQPIVTFEQFFFTNVSTGGVVKDQSSVVSAYPSFDIPGSETPNVGVMQWLGGFIDNGASGPNFGTFFDAPFAPGQFEPFSNDVHVLHIHLHCSLVNICRYCGRPRRFLRLQWGTGCGLVNNESIHGGKCHQIC